MARFYQQVKTLICDIEKFLTEAVKDSKIPKKSLEQKSSILSQIRELRNDYPQLQTADESTPKKETTVPEPELEEESIYEETDVTQAAFAAATEDICKREVSATDISGVTHSGQLKMKKDKKGNLLSKLVAKKCHGVLRGNLFYVYDKKTSKKQNDCFSTEGYQVTLLEDESKKEYGFEMTSTDPDKKGYIFEATTHEELQGWMGHLSPESNRQPEPDDHYSDGEGGGRDIIEEDLYEETDIIAPSTRRNAPIPSASHSPPPVPAQHPRSGPASGGANGGPPPALPARNAPPAPEEDDIYEDGDSQPTNSSFKTPSGESMPKKSIPAEEDQDIYDETGPVSPTSPAAVSQSDDQDIYDETTAPPETPPQMRSPPVNKSSLFSSSLQQQSQRLDGNSPTSSFRRPGGPPTLPKKTLPPPPLNGTAQNPEEDYENMFYGVWDCTADQEKELTFRRGDIITVIDKKYEDRGWWVGRLQDKVGLVPKNFLAAAYERA